MPELCQGRIVWAVVPDKHGHNAYPRPVIILTPQNEISSATELFGVVASNTASRTAPRPSSYIEIPHHPLGMVRTKLKVPTVAVCEWLVSIERSQIISTGGIVPPHVLEAVILKVRELHE